MATSGYFLLAIDTRCGLRIRFCQWFSRRVDTAFLHIGPCVQGSCNASDLGN